MIINIRGTSGSGKSTIVRHLMKGHTWNRTKREGRKQPLSYFNLETGIVIMGHYETACGGCDTIQKMDDTFGLIKEAAEMGFHVIYEGLLISGEVNRTVKLKEDGHELIVFAIDLPVKDCLASVNERRRRKNPDAPDVNPKNTESRHKVVQRCMQRFEAAGVDCQWGTRAELEARIRALLKL